MEASRRSELLCERTREYVSLEVDGELSEFEHGFLVAHLRYCGECRLYRSEIHALARHIRTAPPEVLAHPIRLPVYVASRPTVLARVQLGVAAALAIAVVGTASLMTLSIAPPASPDGQETISSSPTDPNVDFGRSPFPEHRVITPSRAVFGRGTGNNFII